MRKRLTPKGIESLKPGEKQYEVFEGRGFGLRVGRSGKKSWIMLYRTSSGRLRRMTFAAYPETSLADARLAFEGHLKVLAAGDDPADLAAVERRKRREAPTFEQLAGEYMERHAKRNKKSWRTDQDHLERFLKPAFPERKADSVTRGEVIALIEGIAENTPVQANRVLATLKSLYSWGISAALLEVSPVDRVKPPARERPRERFLSADEIRTFWAALTDRVKPAGAPYGEDQLPMSERVALALKLILVTAQRPGEVANASWFEFDLKSALWTIPTERSKNGLPHRVPLSRLALEILARAAAIGRRSSFVFPGKPREDGADLPIGRGALTLAMARSRDLIGLAHATPHDLRRSAASAMTAAGISRLVVSKILNHSERGVTSIYDRHSYDPEKRTAMETWETELRRIVGLEAAEGGQL